MPKSFHASSQLSSLFDPLDIGQLLPATLPPVQAASLSACCFPFLPLGLASLACSLPPSSLRLLCLLANPRLKQGRLACPALACGPTGPYRRVKAGGQAPYLPTCVCVLLPWS